MKTIDEYFETINPSQKAELERIRHIIKKTVPEAEETIKYGMPTFNYRGKRLICFAAYKSHISLFGNLSNMEDKLGSFKLNHVGTLQFSENKPIPEELVREIVLYKLAEVSQN